MGGMVEEQDGQRRPWWAPFATKRWISGKGGDVTYQDYGRVLALGRVFGVRLPVYDARHDASAECCRQGHSRIVGFLIEGDNGELYASPDHKIDVSHIIPNGSAFVPYESRRWVGGFANRGEALAFLRGVDMVQGPDVAAWVEAGWRYPHS